MVKANKCTKFSATILLLLLVILTLSLASFAATYFVSPTGDDSNPGTEQMPFKSIQKAVDSSVEGDSIKLGSGNYSEKVTISKSGTSSAAISIESIDRYGAVMSSSSSTLIDGKGNN